ncbi:MAG: DUF1850 domain-containing protein [Clostridia bacterium]|jgi:hypothetical protein|nr:DUF1850 domain-containing protein [Clostridia bacterium]
MMRKLVFFLLLIVTIVCLWPLYSLEVRADGSGELVCHLPAQTGDTFDIIWTHSVTLQPVIETYLLEKPGQIPLVQMVFDDNGPNLPAHPEQNTKWTMQDGKFIVTGYDLVFERVPVVIGALIANHTLRYNGREISLKDEYRPGGYVHIALVREILPVYIQKEVNLWLKIIQ